MHAFSLYASGWLGKRKMIASLVFSPSPPKRYNVLNFPLNNAKCLTQTDTHRKTERSARKNNTYKALTFPLISSVNLCQTFEEYAIKMSLKGGSIYK